MNTEIIDPPGSPEDTEKVGREGISIPMSRQLGSLSRRAVRSIRLVACRCFARGMLYIVTACLFLVGYSYVWNVNHVLAFIYILFAGVMVVVFIYAGYLAFADAIQQWKGGSFLKKQMKRVQKTMERMEQRIR